MSIDCCCCCRHFHHEIMLRFDGDTMTGWLDGDGRIDGGIDVFKTKGDPRGAAIADRVGSWTGVFDVNEPDRTSGFGTFSMSIKNSGLASIRCKMPDGTSIGTTSKYQVGEDGIGIVPVVFRKGLCGKSMVRGFGFRLVFRPGEASPRVYDISPEQVYSIYKGKLTEMGTIGAFKFGRVVKAPPTVVRVTVQGAGDLSAVPDEIKVKVNKSTNALSGKCTWVSLDRRGKAVKILGTIKSGCVVNGVGYGMLRIRGMGLRPFTCACE